MFKNLFVRAFLLAISVLACAGAAADDQRPSAPDGYAVNAGDILEVFIWNEETLSREVLVRPDGGISVPLAGHVHARGRNIADIEADISQALTRYLRDEPTVTVSLRQTSGYKIYVLGKVNRPGEYPITQPIDVMQALALAGGLNAFAAENSINVLHRDANGTQHSRRFRYGDVKQGEGLSNNSLLHSGDIVVVP